MPEPKTYTEDEYNAMVAERDAVAANRDAALTEAKKAKKALQAWDGKDPAKYDELVAASEEAERKKALAEGNLEVWKKQVTDQHQKEREADAKRVTKLQAALDKRKVAKLTAALAKAEADPTMMDLLVLKGSASVRLRETDDDWEEFVSDEKGNPLVADGQGTPMTIDQFVEKNLKTQYPGAFKGTGSSGGGASKPNAGGGGDRGKIVAATGMDVLNNLEAIAKGEKTVAAV